MLSSRKRELVPPENIEWLFDIHEWLLRNLGGWTDFEKQQLVLPNDAFFPLHQNLPAQEFATALFDKAKEHARMWGWPVSLSAHCDLAPADQYLGGLPYLSRSTGAAGTFAMTSKGDAKITYSENSVEDPMSFIAAMAHELAHYLMHTIEEVMPGGDDVEELATDVCSSFLGFGIFAANAACSFAQYQDGRMIGWRAKRQGYLDERMLVFSLAIFLQSREIDASVVYRFLKINPRNYLKKAVRSLRKDWRERTDGMQLIW